jgi:hypothetical protein
MIRDALEDNPLLRLAAVGPSQSYQQVAARLGVDPGRVAALKAKFGFPTEGKFDNPGHPSDNGLMGGLRELARIAYEIKAHPGVPRFGMTSATSGDGRWQEDAPEE